MYNDTPGLPPDKIAPTVGQNSTPHSPKYRGNATRKKKIATEFCVHSREDRVAISIAPILGSRRPARHPFHMAKVLRRLSRRRLRRRCGRP